ncbi:hypothetical protein GJ744_007282 [Endocarpon pusillum]|uniref:Uncharacterized protein n=1 Tax=Endocarpon pusillum TaxID=364733 RepID=A0A8H7E6G3_9EURO|nr:hypothetical protein GJ744_007282 [Endocarpon pusillum]
MSKLKVIALDEKTLQEKGLAGSPIQTGAPDTDRATPDTERATSPTEGGDTANDQIKAELDTRAYEEERKKAIGDIGVRPIQNHNQKPIHIPSNKLPEPYNR